MVRVLISPDLNTSDNSSLDTSAHTILNGNSYHGAVRTTGRPHRVRSGSQVGKADRHREKIDQSKLIFNPDTRITIDEHNEKPDHVSFFNFRFSYALKKNIKDRNYHTPSPIQDKTIPHVLLGRDVIGIAETGTGKTAAFLLPLISRIMERKTKQVLIIAPTRELALQIERECFLFTKGLFVFSSTYVGGISPKRQIESLQKKKHIFVGTPGRLRDLIQQQHLDISQVDTIVLDEADRMLDMGFIDDIKHLIGLTAKKQCLLFSATFKKEIEEIASQFLVNPLHISVKKQDTAARVTQDIIRVPSKEAKLDKITELLRSGEFEKTIIFTEKKIEAEELALKLSALGFKAESIHGDKKHFERVKALRAFKDNVATVLVATDVAARGLDIPDVTHVINYELPYNYDTYVHRVGRTGRANKTGKAYTFIIGDENRNFKIR